MKIVVDWLFAYTHTQRERTENKQKLFHQPSRNEYKLPSDHDRIISFHHHNYPCIYVSFAIYLGFFFFDKNIT